MPQNNMKVKHLQATMTALSPISHGGESHGNEGVLRREGYVNEAGTEVLQVPTLSGNGMRGLLRRIGMKHMLRRLGYTVDRDTDKVPGLSEAAVYFLLSGGSLSSKGSRSLNIDEERWWVERVPMLELVGSAVGNHCLNGQANICRAVLLCQETIHLMPEKYQEMPMMSCYDLTQREQNIRRDDAKEYKVRQLMSPPERKQIESAMGLRTPDEKARSKSKSKPRPQQMIYFTETVVAGAKFFWEIYLDDVSNLGWEAMITTLFEFSKMPFVCGKSGTGHGKVKIEYDGWMVVDPNVSITSSAIAAPFGTGYLQHLDHYGDDIREALHEFK